MARLSGRLPPPLKLALFLAALLFWVTWSSSSFRTTDPRVAAAARRRAKSLRDIARALDRLEKAPILPYNDALADNDKTCRGRAVQSNPDQVNGNLQFWQSLTNEQISDKRRNLVQAVRTAYRLPEVLTSKKVPLEVLQDRARSYDSLYGTGERGIVYTGGNADTLERVYASVRILRNRHHSSLPIEVFAFPEEMELAPGQGRRGDLEAMGVEFKELRSSPKLKQWKNFQIKGEAILKSSFSEVLYLDSDNILLADPAYLFDHPLYQKTGAVLWPDIVKDGPANPVWRILGKQCNSLHWQVDSGQMVFDKRGQNGLNLAALVIAAEMQRDHDFWFKISGGDKDTFRYGFYAMGLDYSPAPHWLSSYGNVHPYQVDGHTFCGLAMFHYGLSPADWEHFPQAHPSETDRETHAPPLFVHANLLKHSNGYRRGRTFTTFKRIRHDSTEVDMPRPRSNVYWSINNMCVDIWDAFGDTDPRAGGNDGANFENGDIVVEKSTEAFGGVLDGFEEMFYAEGGKAGGM